MLLITFAAALYGNTADFARFEQAKSRFQKGLAFYNEMNYLSAAEFFRSAIAVYPEYVTAREYLARSYRLAGYTVSALNEWESLLEINPDNYSALSRIEALRFRKGAEVDKATDFSDYILSSVYSSRNYGRFRFDKPVDFTFDSNRNVYISSFSTGRVVRIDINGNAIDHFTPARGGKIYGLDSAENVIAASDFEHNRVYFLTPDGNKINEFGETGSEKGAFHGPRGISLGEEGYIYVVDAGNNRIQKFSADGRFVLEFGKAGQYESELSNPTDVAFYNGYVYVTDTGNSRISCFDRHGNFMWNDRVSGLRMPRGISASDDRLFIADERKGLLIYNLVDGSSEWHERFGDETPEFSRLYAAAPDREGNLYTLDYNRESLYLFVSAKAAYTNLDLEITSVDTGMFPVVAFYVNLRDREGRPVYGLTRDNFTVTENNAAVTGIYTDYLKTVDPSVSMVFCFDRSESNRKNHDKLGWAADFILSSMRKNDRARMIDFSSDVSEGNPFDWSRRRALQSINRENYSSGKAAGQALYSSISDLLTKVNRRGVVLFTDGSLNSDSFSMYSPETVIAYANAHFIPVYIVSFGEPDEIFSRIADRTGGDVLRAHETDSLKEIYGRIKESEEYRYVIAYQTFNLDSFRGWWSDVKIEVDYKSRKGIEWGGYFAPEK